MDANIYNLALVILASFLSLLGGLFIVNKVQESLKGSPYHVARRFMGAAFLVLAVSIVIHMVTGVDRLAPRYRIALNLSSYFIAAKLIAISFISFVGGRVDFKAATIQWKVAYVTVMPIFALSTVAIPDFVFRCAMQVFMIFIFVLGILTDVKYIFKTYSDVIKSGKYIYDNGVTIDIGWIRGGAYALISLGFVSSFVALSSHRLSLVGLFLFMFYFVAVMIYISSHLLQFPAIFNDHQEKKLVEESMIATDPIYVKLSPKVYQKIEEGIADWIDNKLYCRAGVTLQETATELSVNKNYLSTYINAKYATVYKVWIQQLRIAEAKEIMKSQPQTTIISVAQRVGYVSSASFNHAFKGIEGVSPTEWMQSLK